MESLITSNFTDSDDMHNRTYRKPSRMSTVLAASVMGPLLLIGVVGAILITVVLLSRRDMRSNVINMFIISLCINDLLNLLSNQTMVLASYVAHDWVLGPFLCAVMPEFNMILVAVSLWHHALIAIHRYLVVVQSIFYRQMDKTRYAILVIVGTRLFPAVLSIALALALNRHSQDPVTIYSTRLLRCIYNKGQQVKILIVVVFTLLIPCAVVFVCFASIFIYVHRIGRRSVASDRGLLKRELQITKMFGVVFLLFLLGYIPYGFVRMGEKSRPVSPETYVVVTVLYACASCLNTVIFGAMNQDIHRAVLNCIGCSAPSSPSSRSQSMNQSMVAQKVLQSMSKENGNNQVEEKPDAALIPATSTTTDKPCQPSPV